MISDELVDAHRARALTPDRSVLRGSAANPDSFFQAREAANGFYDACPATVQRIMDHFAEVTGRRYRLFDYVGHPEAERVLVLMARARRSRTRPPNGSSRTTRGWGSSRCACTARSRSTRSSPRCRAA